MLFGSPAAEEWEECSMVEQIMTRLQLTKRDVLRTLEAISDSITKRCNVFDPNRRVKASCGGKVAIVDMDPSTQVIYKAMSNGSSVTMATYMLTYIEMLVVKKLFLVQRSKISSSEASS